jgi:hypothetical protein
MGHSHTAADLEKYLKNKYGLLKEGLLKEMLLVLIEYRNQ